MYDPVLPPTTPELVRIAPADARRVAWKNGRGFTDELVVAPAGAAFERGDFDWRISKACVAERGPFSAFPGFDRVLVVLAGDGLVLDHGGAAPRRVVRPLEPHAFSGDWTTGAELIGGPVADFNVLARRGRVRADVAVLHLDARPFREPLAAGDAFLHVVAGSADARVVGIAAASALGAGESLWIRGAKASDALEVTDAREGGVALLVRLASV